MKKIYCYYIAILFMSIISIPIFASPLNNDVVINISSGKNGKNIGFGITIEVFNNKDEEILIYYNYIIDRIFSMEMPFLHFNTTTIKSGENFREHISINYATYSTPYRPKIYKVHFYVSIKDINDIKYEKHGRAIKELVIFFR